MSTRDDILARVRRNQPAPVALPAIPRFATAPAPSIEQFTEAVLRMGGKVVERPQDGDLTRLVRTLFPQAAVIASATGEVAGNRELTSGAGPAGLADVDVGVVRAVFGVTETGSVWLTSAQFKVNSLGFLAQHLVVLLDPASLVGSMHDAYALRDCFDTGYGVFMTGPSATADIEGILIHGAQGIRSLTIIPVAAG